MRAAMLPPRLCLLLVGALALTACPRRVVDFGDQGEPTSAADLLKRINVAENQVYSLKGDAKLHVDSPQGKGAVSIFVSVTHPSFIYLEQLDFFGRPQGALVTDGERFGLYLAPEGKYYRGPASPVNLARFLPVVIPPRELAAILLGRAPRISSEDPRMGFDEQKQQLTLTLTRGEGKQTLWVQPPSYRVVRSVPENLPAYELAFDDVVAQQGLTLPRKAILDAAGAGTHVELHWKEVAVNEAPDLSLYQFEPPEGVPVVEVDAAGKPSEPPAQ